MNSDEKMLVVGLEPHASQSVVDCIDLSEFKVSLRSRIRLPKIDMERAEIPVVNCLIDTGAVGLIELTVVETHEVQQPSLMRETDALRDRIKSTGNADRFRLDWL